MIVLKFGSTALDTPEHVQKAKEIIEKTEGECIVVTAPLDGASDPKESAKATAKALCDAVEGSFYGVPDQYLSGHQDPHVKTAVIPGYIPDGVRTGEFDNLENGGAADYLASLIASANKADSLVIWTDYDGFMTADPLAVRTAYVIKEMTYREAMELCNFGSSLICSTALYPVLANKIPLIVKNFHNPAGSGTTIKESAAASGKSIRGISSIDDVCLISLSGNSL
ncbi:MAG: hypothetical protein MJY84_07275, partial [Bacteroidales bacterium]|nr:hypothetical protein [Bacteroidales bacterium]